MLTKTLSEAKKKQRNILIKAMNNDIGSIVSSKDSWNPAQISERAKDISYIRSLVDSWNPAQLNEALKMLDLPVIDTWNPAQIEEQRRNLVFYLAERTLTGNPITVKILGNLTPEVTGLKVSMSPIQDLSHGEPSPSNICPITGRTEVTVTRTAGEDVETYTKEFGQTVYGGTLDMTSGKLTIDKVITELDGTETGWLYYGGDNSDLYYIDNKIVGASTEQLDLSSMLCNKYPYNDALYPENAFRVNSSLRLYIGDNRYINDLNGFKSSLSDGLQIVYKLATPTTIQLSPEEITLLKGINVLSTDGDSIELKYKQNF